MWPKEVPELLREEEPLEIEPLMNEEIRIAKRVLESKKSLSLQGRHVSKKLILWLYIISKLTAVPTERKSWSFVWQGNLSYYHLVLHWLRCSCWSCSSFRRSCSCLLLQLSLLLMQSLFLLLQLVFHIDIIRYVQMLVYQLRRYNKTDVLL